MSPPTRLALLTLLSASASASATLYFIYKSRHRQLLTRLLKEPFIQSSSPSPSKRGKLFFLSQTNTSKTLARRLHALLTLNDIPFDFVDPKDYEPEDLCKESLVVIVASTWENGGPPQNGSFLANWLIESVDDFRVGALALKDCKYAVFGVGSRSYVATYNDVARGVSEKLRKLGATEIVELGEGERGEEDLDEVFDGWSDRVVGVLKDLIGENRGHFENGQVGSQIEGEVEFSDSEEDDDDSESGVVDLEDIAGKGPSRKSMMGTTANGKVNGEVVNGDKEMVTPVIRASLQKQLYSNLYL